MEIKRFKNRTDAGRLLAEKLTQYAHREDVNILALPRGGVPVASEVATALDAPLDILLVRKLGVPGFEELAMGAIAAGGVVINSDVVQAFNISRQMLEQASQRALLEIERREKLYRSGRAPLDLHGRTVILVDDGLATGSTMHAAIEAARREHPARIVVAVPVGAADTCDRLQTLADEVICLRIPDSFRAVGSWYENFRQTDDDEVIALLNAAEAADAAREHEHPHAGASPPNPADDSGGLPSVTASGAYGPTAGKERQRPTDTG